MSGGLLTINGGFNGQTGLVGTPSDFPTTINQLLQDYLNGVSTSLIGGSEGLENYDAFSPGSPYFVPGPNLLEEITNTDSNGSVSSGTVTGSVTVNPLATQLIVQAPGNFTVNGNDSTSFALFGAASNVDYIANGSQTGSIFAAGGADTINLGFNANSSAESIYSAGKDLIQLFNQGDDQVSISGNANDTVQIQEADATVTATGNSTVNVFWYAPNSGGSLDFINNSSVYETVNGGIFNGVQSATHVTVDGGAGGGYYVAGAGGGSSLYGGSGDVFLVGAGPNDTLEATGSTALPGNPLEGNALFSGGAREVLIATSTTDGNVFAAGYEYPGFSTPPVANGIISSQGSGLQEYFLGSTQGETVYGSTVASATNSYNVISDSTVGVGSGNDYIVNFVSSGNDFIDLSNYAYDAPGTASISSITADSVGNPTDPNGTLIALSDGTDIHLIGFNPADVFTTTGANGTLIY